MTRRQRLRWLLWNLGIGACDRFSEFLFAREWAGHVPWCFLHPDRLIRDLPLTDADWEAAGWDKADVR